MPSEWPRILVLQSAMIAIAGSIAFAQPSPVPCTNRPSITRTPQTIAFKVSRVGDLLAFAYDLPLDRIERRPQWMYDYCYDVELNTPAPASLPEQKQMLQKLFEARFGLVTHRISYPSPVYFLVRGPNVNLTPAAEPDDAGIPEFHTEPPQPGLPLSRAIYATHMSMSDLATWLYWRVQLPVLDKTGLTGFFDMEIMGMPANGAADGIIRAVQDSLGLILESHKGTAESIIIDHAEQPK